MHLHGLLPRSTVSTKALWILACFPAGRPWSFYICVPGNRKVRPFVLIPPLSLSLSHTHTHTHQNTHDYDTRTHTHWHTHKHSTHTHTHTLRYRYIHSVSSACTHTHTHNEIYVYTLCVKRVHTHTAARAPSVLPLPLPTPNWRTPAMAEFTLGETIRAIRDCNAECMHFVVIVWATAQFTRWHAILQPKQ